MMNSVKRRLGGFVCGTCVETRTLPYGGRGPRAAAGEGVSAPRRPRGLVLAAVLGALVLAVCSLSAPQRALALDLDADPIQVHNVDEMIDLIKRSRGMVDESYMSFEGRTIALEADIDFKSMADGEGKIDQIITELGSLTFGDKDHPFKGEFDGRGHYIRHLDYHRDLWKPKANTGLFSFTDGAYLHDVHFSDCYVGADFRGGVLVGQARNTHIESVRMEDCIISVTPANNAVSLITNAGVMGGIIAGEMLDKSYMYDCTVQGGRAVNNSVVAVSGLGGEGLYLGALVGSAEDSQIEYCRVLPNNKYYIDRSAKPDTSVYARDDNGHYKYQTEVYNRYEVAVGAVAGQGVYAGGIVGYTNDVDVVDCFSTAWVHTWVANYVGVGSGNIGYVGGIIAHAKSGSEGANASQVIRCHYAGNMESYQWNAVAVIPIIQSNVYLSGLVERDWNEDTGLYNSYFKRNDIVGKDSAIKPHPNGYVRAWGDWLGLNYSGGEHGPSAQGFSYGPIVDDAKYADRLFWEGEGYDFEGDEVRLSTIDNQIPGHVNKWIMDDYLGIPVHGDSVKATLDFPGAGDVTISQSTLGKEQKTADPYNFAVQPVSANETELTFTATVNNDRAANTALAMVSSDANEGFRFQGWFRNKGVTSNHIQQGKHAFFDPMVPPEPNGEQVSAELEHVATNSGTGADEGAQFSDNDLFVAYYQAQVLFHDVKGDVIDKDSSATEATPQTDDDWYNHQDALPGVGEPKADREGGENAPVAGAAKFLGWTTQKNKVTGGGWPDVTTPELNAMKASGTFFEGGEPIERPMDLYPVYASLGANINVIAEGHELDSTSSDVNVREGVAQATVTAKDGKYELGINGLSAEGALPDGYRFLGWYEVKQNANGEPVYKEKPDVVYNAAGDRSTAYQYEFGRKLSGDPVVTIPDDVDLTQKHYYYARFEYRVDYYASAYLMGGIAEWESPRLYTERWKTYCSSFDKLRGPEFYRETIDHWSLNEMIGGHVSGDDAATLLAGGIVAHHVVNGHNEKTSGGVYDIVATFDFPNSARIYMSGNPDNIGKNFELKAEPTDPAGFKFIGWSWQQNSNEGTSPNNPWETGAHFTKPNRYSYEAHLVAQVRFVDAGENVGDKVVSRAYSDYAGDAGFTDGFQKVFMESDSEYEFRYLKYTGGDASEEPNGLKVAIEASPSDEYMQKKRPDSLFLGWIDKYELKAGTMTEGEYESLYSEDTRTAKVSIDTIEPYLVKEDRLCDRPMMLYPVYADYSCETTTNITRGTALTEPANPEITPALADVAINGDGTKTVAVKADIESATVEKYSLASWTIESPEGTVIDTIRATDGNGNPVTSGGAAVGNDNAKLVYTIKAGSHYVIVANYEATRDAELDVTYHVRPSGEAGSATKVVAKKAGEPLGRGPVPEFKVDGAAFVGWTEQQPAKGAEYLMFDAADASKMVDEYTIVEHSMELWPIYRIIGTEGDQANVRVNSNIDNTDGVGVDHRRATVKTASTPQGPQTYVALEADAVDGYKFIGWYKDYIDMTVDADGKATVEGTPVPGSRVTGDEMFAGNLYTAVYQKTQVYKVVYHFPDMDGADGPLEASTDTIEFTADDKSAFVQKITVQKPIIGPDGNPVYNPDGTPQMEDVEVEATVVGGEQTAAMEGFLSKKDAEGQVKELFKEWEWKKSDTETVPWDAFCRASIVESMTNAGVTEMHLYPVTHRLNALDQDGAPYAASNLVWQIDPAALEKEVADPNAEGATPAVKIAFGPRTLYLGDTLTVHMDQVHYAKPEADRAASVDGKLVAIFDNFDFTKAKQLDKKATGHLGVGHEGDAVFEFDTTGSLTIEKTAPLMAAGSTFTFTVTECDENGEVAQDAKSATVTMTAQDNGQGAATASETINVPWGYYKVVETSWGWRYSPTYQFFEGGMTVEGRPDNVVLVRSQGTAKVTNALTNDKYLDGEDRAKNVFGVGRNPVENGGGR
ncbi:hypothetical protein [Collinsella stercoris]|uniref:hypothetical protein n=1 Tax=Collinsella stercoris TaxID=147206 RepID=UPI0026E99E13|nr:hypothetical protein [Collinsella stercoris]MBS6555250.1 hypothetical protein [Collinsella stercoris]